MWNKVLHSAYYAIIGGLIIIQHHRYLKINNFRIHIRIQEDVVWFQIHMDNVLFMQVMYMPWATPSSIWEREAQSSRDSAKVINERTHNQILGCNIQQT